MIGQDFGKIFFTEEQYIGKPSIKEVQKIFRNKLDNKIYVKKFDGTIELLFNSSSSIWGSITGNISNQLDLINYINTPRVINQIGGANVTFDSRITDLVVLDANQNFLINYPTTPGSKDGQIVVLDVCCTNGSNPTISIDGYFKIYNGVVVENIANFLYIITFVFKYSELTGLWYLYNCTKALN